VKTLTIVLLAILFITVGCEKQAELDKQTTARIYVDKLFLQEKFSDNSDTVKLKLDSMFLHYHTSEAVFDSSIKFYMADEKRLDDFFDVADDYVDTLKIRTSK